MKTRYLHILSALAVLALSMTGCIYPFEIDTGEESSDEHLVIEGDILIGEISTVKLSYVRDLRYTEESPEVYAYVSVEDSDGLTYHGRVSASDGGRTYMIDTRMAEPGRKYRLVVTTLDGKSYASEWAEPTHPADIDSISWIKDEEHGRIAIALSMHSDDNEHYFRWNYDETWEYHTLYYSRLQYLPPVTGTYTWNGGYGMIEELPYGLNYYYCWQQQSSTDVMIFSTEQQTEDRFQDLEFLLLYQGDSRLSVMYNIKVYLSTLTKDAYRYWQNMRTNSDQSGSLFTPNPSEMIGNIRSLDNPDELVIGYISVVQRESASMYMSNDDLDGFYQPSGYGMSEPKYVAFHNWLSAYYSGLAPVNSRVEDFETKYYWAPRGCVDCRALGGTKVKPEGWPTDHN